MAEVNWLFQRVFTTNSCSVNNFVRVFRSIFTRLSRLVLVNGMMSNLDGLTDSLVMSNLVFFNGKVCLALVW